MTAQYIAPEWLAVAGGSLFHCPASGADLAEPIGVFLRHVSTLIFRDIAYEKLDHLRPARDVPPDRISYAGPHGTFMTWTSGSRHLAPGTRTETHERPGAAPLGIARRGGFGQMGLAELLVGSIRVFMHRGDSTGDGGLEVWFFGDRNSVHPPLRNPFQTLQSRLADRALIVTDGSNALKTFLDRYTFPAMSGEDAFATHSGKTDLHRQLTRECVGWLSPRYGPTLVWEVTCQAHAKECRGPHVDWIA